MVKFNYNSTGTNHKIYPGRYKVSIRKPGYNTITEDIYVDNSEISKSFELTKLPLNFTFPVKQISGGYQNLFMLDANNNLFCIGDNSSYYMGLGEYNKKVLEVIQITNDYFPSDFSFPIKKVYTSQSTVTYVIDNNGSLYAAGSNSAYLLGLDLSDTSYKAKFFNKTILPAEFAYPIKDIVSGYRLTLITDSNNILYGCGSDSYGFGVSYLRKFTKIPDSYIPDNNSNLKVFIGKFNPTVVTDTSIYVAGSDYSGELGLGFLPENNEGNTTYKYQFTKIPEDKLPVDITFPIKNGITGYSSSHIVDSSNNIYCCGGNVYGELGIGTRTTFDYGTDENPRYDIIVDERKSVFTKIPANKLPVGMTFPIKQIQCGYYCTIILDNSGYIYMAGAGQKSYGSAAISGYNNDPADVSTVFKKIMLPGDSTADMIISSDRSIIAVNNLNNKIYVLSRYDFTTGVDQYDGYINSIKEIPII